MRSAALGGVGVFVTAVTGFLHGESQKLPTLMTPLGDVTAMAAPEAALSSVLAVEPLESVAPAEPVAPVEPVAPSPVASAVMPRSASRAPTIALQAGHWRADEAPWELRGLKGNGTSWQDVHEWQANLQIARRAGAMLEELGYQVDVLPAVVPPSYRADLFIAIHADGSGDPNASGYRVASPRRDRTGRARDVARILSDAYGEATGLRRIPTVTRRMRNYYAFNSRRYRHALHPSTVGVIIETGFLTSPRDRRVILDDPDRAARGIVAAVTAYPDTRPPEQAGS